MVGKRRGDRVTEFTTDACNDDYLHCAAECGAPVDQKARVSRTLRLSVTMAGIARFRGVLTGGSGSVDGGRFEQFRYDATGAIARAIGGRCR